MKNFYLTLSIMFILLANAFGQHQATITITNELTASPIENVNVTLNDETLLTNSSGQVVFTNLSDNTYDYNFWGDCYISGSGSLTIAGADVNEANVLALTTSNDVFFFIGSPMAITGSTVILTDNADFYQEFVTTDPWGGETISEVPFGEYSYTITTPCYETVTGNVTVDCNEGMGVMVAAEPDPATDNDVFFFIGSPMAITGSTVILTDNADFYQEFVTTDPWGGETISEVPFGEYSYTITTPCYETVTGNVTVDCNEGMGVMVAAEPDPATTNFVIFYIGEPLTISGALITLTDSADFNATITTGAPFGDVVYDIPYGEYTYTISANCYETLSGTVTVDCNEGQGIMVAENPVQFLIDTAVSQDGNILTAASGTFTYQWIDCDNENTEIAGEVGQSFTATTDGNYAVIISAENCISVSECIQVVVSGLSEFVNKINVSVYPNPVAETIKIQTPATRGTLSVKIMSITGQVILSQNFTGSEINVLNVTSLTPGTYILNVVNEEGQFATPIVKI